MQIIKLTFIFSVFLQLRYLARWGYYKLHAIYGFLIWLVWRYVILRDVTQLPVKELSHEIFDLGYFKRPYQTSVSDLIIFFFGGGGA
jgi:hypothetical protein